MAGTLNIFAHQSINPNACVRLPDVQGGWGGAAPNQSPTKAFKYNSTLGVFLTSASESHNKDGATTRQH